MAAFSVFWLGSDFGYWALYLLFVLISALISIWLSGWVLLNLICSKLCFCVYRFSFISAICFLKSPWIWEIFEGFPAFSGILALSSFWPSENWCSRFYGLRPWWLLCLRRAVGFGYFVAFDTCLLEGPDLRDFGGNLFYDYAEFETSDLYSFSAFWPNVSIEFKLNISFWSSWNLTSNLG